jgi:hypothetical protein
MRELERIHNELQRGNALRKIVIDEAHHGLPGQARQRPLKGLEPNAAMR